MQVSLPRKVDHRASMLPKQSEIRITKMLQLEGLTLTHKVIFIALLAYVRKCAYPMCLRKFSLRAHMPRQILTAHAKLAWACVP